MFPLKLMGGPEALENLNQNQARIKIYIKKKKKYRQIIKMLKLTKKHKNNISIRGAFWSNKRNPYMDNEMKRLVFSL